jgi:hypothetical protein
MEFLSIAMEMATATQRAEKKRALGLGVSLPRGSRPAVALRFHAAVARAAAVSDRRYSPETTDIALRAP